MPPGIKTFSLTEAQNAVREIQPALTELTELKKKLDDKGYDVYRHQYFGGMGPNGQKVFPVEMERLVVLVQTLNTLGIEIKDLNKGLIDFPYQRKNGDIVYLCYLLGEPEIVAWHSIAGGYAARQSLETL